MKVGEPFASIHSSARMDGNQQAIWKNELPPPKAAYLR